MPAPAGVAGLVAGAMPLRRLTRDEISYTVEDLLGDTSRPGSKFPDETPGSGGFATAGSLSALDFRRVMDMSEQVATTATENLARLLPCDPVKVGDDTCAVAFIETFGRRAFRRKLAAAELGALQALYTKARGEFKYDFKGGIGLVLQSMLQSPYFLYRWELGTAPALKEGALVKLNGDEVAARLSYLLWSSLPDDALFRAADTGQLGAAAGVEAQARRMLADPRARRSLASFHAQWLHLSSLREFPKDTVVYPAFTAEARKAMEDELGAFVSNLYQGGDGKFATLLTAPFSFVNGALARIYGLAPGAAGAELTKQDLDPTRRAGVLTQVAFLSRQASPYGSHPVKRGQVLFEQVLCGHVPPPPADIPMPKAQAPSLSTRDRYAEHSANPGCGGCHRFLDPLGFAFENYDGIGQYRAMDGGKAVDATGTVNFPNGDAKPFKNAVEMGRLLAASEDARRCMTSTWVRYALGRAEGPDDSAGLGGIHADFARSGYDLRELVLALARSGIFLYRRPAAGEVL